MLVVFSCRRVAGSDGALVATPGPHPQRLLLRFEARVGEEAHP